MVDQANVAAAAQPTNGRAELPPRAVARNTGEFLHDITTLAELQGKLLLVECQQGLRKLVMPVVLLVLGLVLALGSVPIALAAVAITLVQAAELSLAVAMWVAFSIGLLMGGGLAAAGYWGLRSKLAFLDRSYYEWQRNVAWAKDTLKRLSGMSRAPLAR